MAESSVEDQLQAAILAAGIAVEQIGLGDGVQVELTKTVLRSVK